GAGGGPRSDPPPPAALSLGDRCGEDAILSRAPAESGVANTLRADAPPQPGVGDGLGGLRREAPAVLALLRVLTGDRPDLGDRGQRVVEGLDASRCLGHSSDLSVSRVPGDSRRSTEIARRTAPG